MFPQSILDAAALDSSFTRAVRIVRSGGILRLDAGFTDEDAGIVQLAGSVHGNYGEDYAVTVTLDLAAGKVHDHYCSCPAAAKYPGMCKHSIAVALQYLVRAGRLEGLRKTLEPRRAQTPAADDAPAQDAPAPRRAPAPAPRAEADTSRAVAAMMVAYAGRAQMTAEAAAAAAQDPAELADLQVTLGVKRPSFGYYVSTAVLWTITLRVSRGKRAYVVRHIDELVAAWRGGQRLAYGKNLAFVHGPHAFNDRSNALIEVLARVMDAQWALQTSRELSSFNRQPNLSTKTLLMSEEQAAEVLDLMQGGQVTFEFPEHGSWRNPVPARKVTLDVREGDPRLAVALAPAEAGGYTLTVEPAEAVCLWTDARLYVIDDSGAWRATPRFHDELGPFCWSLLPTYGKALHIREADMPQFCAAVLPALRRHVRLHEEAELDDVMPPQAAFEFRIGLQDGYITCQGVVRYDDVRLDLFEPVRAGQPVRHVEREMAAQQAVAAFFPNGVHDTPQYDLAARTTRADEPYYDDDPWGGRVVGGAPDEPPLPHFAEDDDEAYFALFSEGLRALSALGEVLLSERLANVQLRSAPSVRVDASVTGNLLDLQVEATGMSPGELAAYLAGYRRRQRYVRLANGDIVRLDGSIGTLGELAAGLGVSEDELAEGGVQLPANRTLFVDAVLKRGGVRFERDEGFRQIVREFDTVADADFPVPSGLADVLRPYQVEGFKWLCTLGKLGFGGILADDMGLGKTLQMAAYLLHAREAGAGPAVVACPASLVYNWRAELERFAPELRAVAVVGGAAARRKAIAAAAGGGADVLLTSYDLLRRDVEAYAPHRFSCVVLDEAQYVKNSSTKAARAVRQLQADVRFALTGTPIENRLAELWSIFDFLMPGTLGTAEGFSRRFADPIGSGDDDAAKRLAALVAPFILRRLKGDVLRDLPDKNESIVYAQLEGEQDKLYRASVERLAGQLAGQSDAQFTSGKLAVLAELTKLRQVCCDPRLLYENYAGGSAKLDACADLVRAAVEGGHSVLVFSQFTSMFPLIEDRLDEAGVRYLELTGATSKEERVNLVERFQAREAPVFLISLKAGGVGLNLTAADIVVHYDPWWNLAAQNQATDRAHRIGQDRAVSVFKLIAKGTIEERIVELQERKRDLAERVLGAEGVGAPSLTRDDLLALLGA